jgi:transposase
MKLNINSLPNDPVQLKKLLLELQHTLGERDAEIGEQNKIISEQLSQINQFIEAYELARHKTYGKKSEKLAGNDEVFNEAEDILDDEDKKTIAQGNNQKTSPAKQSPKRKPLPKDLEREIITIDVTDTEKFCDCCEGELHQIGEATSEKLEFIPARIKVIETRRPKYSCRRCEKEATSNDIKIAPAPLSPIPKGIATASLLSQIISGKYQYGLPLYRQESMFRELGIELSRKSMSQWVLRCSELLEPITHALRQHLLKQRVINADETTLNVINEEKSTCYMWVYCAGKDRLVNRVLPNIVLYDYQDSRRGECVVNYLDGYTGYLQVDGYQAYGQTQATLAGCMAHARRKFTDAKAVQPTKKTGKSDVVLSLIQTLYGIESSLVGKSVEDIKVKRQAQSKPILNKIQTWALAHREKVPEKSKLGIAIKYWLNQWPKLTTYLEDGQITIDNNRAERAVKPFVIGRKNWLFSNTSRGAKASAILYSLIETAKANGLFVDSYLQYCLNELAKNPDDVEYLLPWNVKPV